MNKYFKNFIYRGLEFGGLCPIVFVIICLIHENISDEFYISGKEIFWAIISIYALAFVQAGASVFNQIEEWSLLKCTTFHFLTLYLAYMICYIFNRFLPFKAEILILFTIIFVIVYFAVWTVVVVSIKCVSKKMNKRLADLEK